MSQEFITADYLAKFQAAYDQDPRNALAAKAVFYGGIDAAAEDPEVVKRHTFVFGQETPQGEATAQKSSGRCWYFASLNTLRQIVMEKLNVENFEFSETHLYFYDKLEKANTYLEHMIRLADRDITDREVEYLLPLTVYDGGYWEFFVPLCLKYGLIPQTEGPESFHSADSYMFTKQMSERLLRTAMAMRKAKKAGKSDADLRQMKEEALAEVYNIAVKSLGKPVEKFSYSYRDKDKEYHRLPEMTPVEFFEKYVGKEELEKRIVLVSDPTEVHPYGRRLLKDVVKSVYEAEPAGGLNVPMEVMTQAILKSIEDKVPVWFACDVGKYIDRKKGILDTELFAYDQVLTPIGDFSKADRFACGYSRATHAMNITGVELDAQGEPVNWKVENSWGKDLGDKGTFSMSHQWFLEYAFEAIIDKKYVPEGYLKGLEEEPIRLKPWDLFCSALFA